MSDIDLTDDVAQFDLDPWFEIEIDGAKVDVVVDYMEGGALPMYDRKSRRTVVLTPEGALVTASTDQPDVLVPSYWSRVPSPDEIRDILYHVVAQNKGTPTHVVIPADETTSKYGFVAFWS